MSTNNKNSLISLVQDVLKRHDCFFDVINENTLQLHSFDSMSPIFEISCSGVALTCPIAYYETDEQCNAVLELCEEYRHAPDDLSPFSDKHDNPLRQNLPEDARFEIFQEQRLIVVSSFFSQASILEDSEMFYSAASSMTNYLTDLYRMISRAIYDRMPKTITEPTDPRSVFYSAMLLIYHIEDARPWRMVDFIDVKVSFRHSYIVFFYPSLTADSYDDLVTEIENCFQKDISANEPFQMVISLTLPQKFFAESFKSQNPYTLGVKFKANHIHINLYKADDGHPFTAETMLLKINK